MLLRSAVTHWAKLRFLAEIVQLYHLAQADVVAFCHEHSFRNHSKSAAPHDAPALILGLFNTPKPPVILILTKQRVGATNSYVARQGEK